MNRLTAFKTRELFWGFLAVILGGAFASVSANSLAQSLAPAPVKMDEPLTDEKKAALDRMMESLHLEVEWPVLFMENVLEDSGQLVMTILDRQGSQALTAKQREMLLADSSLLLNPAIIDAINAAYPHTDLSETKQRLAYELYGAYFTREEIEQLNAIFQNPLWKNCVAPDTHNSRATKIYVKFTDPEVLASSDTDTVTLSHLLSADLLKKYYSFTAYRRPIIRDNYAVKEILQQYRQMLDIELTQLKRQ